MSPSAPPPPRFKVVERGRRLEVIDTQAGGSPPSGTRTTPVPRERGGSPGWWPRRSRFDGTVEFTTLPLYDNKGPRLVTLDPGNAQRLGWARWGVAAGGIGAAALVALNPWLLIAGAALGNAKVRDRVRAWATKLVDKAAV